MSTFLGMISQEEMKLERILSFTRHNLFTDMGKSLQPIINEIVADSGRDLSPSMGMPQEDSSQLSGNNYQPKESMMPSYASHDLQLCRNKHEKISPTHILRLSGSFHMSSA